MLTLALCASRWEGQGNATGAENVLTWQSGYPFAVNLARGYPRFGPGEYTAMDVLGRAECDAALIVAGDPMSLLAPAAREHLTRIPTIVLHSQRYGRHPDRNGRVSHRDLRCQHARNRLSRRRGADPAAAGPVVAAAARCGDPEQNRDPRARNEGVDGTMSQPPHSRKHSDC